MAAGSVGTSRILVRARATGAIPDLPDGLSGQQGTNGDRFYAWTGLDEDVGTAQGGPVVLGSKEWAGPRAASTVIRARCRQWARTPRRSCSSASA